MKTLLLIISLFFSCLILAQDKRIVKVNPGEKVIDKVPKDFFYFYPEFTHGSVVYKNGKSKPYALNYHLLLNQLQYLNSKNEVFPVDDEDVEFVIIGKDTLYHGRFYFSVLKDYGKIKLVSRQVLVFISYEKDANNPGKTYENQQIINNAAYLKNVTPFDTLRLARFEVYYLVDVLNQIWSVHRSYLIKQYPHREKALIQYLTQSPVSILDRNAIEKMLDFLTAKQ